MQVDFKTLYELCSKGPDGVVRIVDHSNDGQDYIVEIRKAVPTPTDAVTTYGTLAGS